MAEQLFRVEDNFPDFQWDPESGICPPDRLSLWHTQDLAMAIRLRRYARQDSEEEIRVAIAGDTGLYTIGLIQKLVEAKDPYAEGPLQVDVFDTDPNALATAERNIATYGRYLVGFSANIFQADWNEDEVWQRFRDNPVHFLISNPPFLPTPQLRKLRAAYGVTSPTALDGGTDGLDHVRALLEHSSDALVDEGPTGVFLRYSYHSDQAVVGDTIDHAFANSPHHYQKSLRTRYAAGPSSLGMALNDITRGDDRILATASVGIRPVNDVMGNPVNEAAARLSLQHAAVLGGVVLSKSMYQELRTLRLEIDLSFAEEQVLISGLHYMTIKMGRRFNSFRQLGYLPGWEYRRLATTFGHRKLTAVQNILTEQYLTEQA